MSADHPGNMSRPTGLFWCAVFIAWLLALGVSQAMAIELKSYAEITAGNIEPGTATENTRDGNTATQLYVAGSPDVSDPTKNWVQFDFSGTVQINTIRLLTNSSDRLNKGRVYLSASPYPNQVNAELIKTFGSSEGADQTISVGSGRSGQYLIFMNDSTQISDERYAFKIREIYIDGQYSSAEPVIKVSASTITLPDGFNNVAGTPIPLVITVFEPQGQEITITANNTAKFTLTNNGDNSATLKLSQPLDLGSHTVTITATDSENNQSTKDVLIDFPFSADDNIASFGIASQGTPKTSNQNPRAAIDNNNATFQQSWCAKEHNWWQLEMPKQTKIQQIDMLLSSSKNTADGAIYLLNGPFNPFDTLQSQLTTSNKVANFTDGTSLLSYKFPENTHRYLLIKGNGEQCLSLAEVSVFGKLSAAPQFLRTYDSELISASAAVNTTVLTVNAQDFQSDPISYYLNDNVPFSIDIATGAISVSQPLQSDYLYSFNVIASDGTNSTTTAVKLRTAKASALTDALTSADASGVLLGDIYDAILSEIAPGSSAIDSTTTATTQDLHDVITKLKNGSFTFPLELCENSSWHSSDCENDHPEFNTFWNVAFNWARKSLRKLDETNTKIFSNPTESNKLLRLLVLLGDKLRQDVVFPMDILTTDKNVFLRSFFADHLVYNSRDFAPVPNNLGTLSRTDFSGVTRTDKTVSLYSRKPFRSAGVYALPGQKVTVTRNDSTSGAAKIFVNSLRKEAMHTFAEQDYMRPAYPQSAAISIAPNQTVSFTSVYGGPIQVEFSSNDDLIELKFENIALHPYWNGPEDNVAFTNAVAKGEFDWAEIATPMYELHSRIFEMRNTLAEWTGGVQEVAKLMMEYTYKHIYTFGAYDAATFPSNTDNTYYSLIDIPTDISSFARDKGLSLIPYDIVQHLNADQPWSGYGTAGNPIDRYGNFNPLSHVDLHETGHNVELRTWFTGFQAHSVTDLHPFYAQSMFNQARGANEQECWELNFELVFNRIQEGFGSPDKDTIFLTTPSVGGGAHEYLQSVSFIQILMAAQDAGVVENGWYVMSRLKLLGVAFKEAKESETAWDAAKNALGLGNYTLAEAEAMSDDDWLLIAFSVATARDLRSFLAVYGHQFSQKAKDQVDAFNYAAMPLRFYVSSTTGICKLGENGDLLDKPWLPIDGNATWPAATDSDGDGYWNAFDAFPNNANETLDSDGDGYGDNADAFPNDASEWLDSDGDGVGNNADTDDDGDKHSDVDEIKAGADPLNSSSVLRASLNDDALACGPTGYVDSDILAGESDFLAKPAEFGGRAWNGSWMSATLSDIEANFSAARALDSSVLPAYKTLTLPGDYKTEVCPNNNNSCDSANKVAKWFTLSIQARGLFLSNSERVARGLPPFEGVSTSVASVAQQYAQKNAELGTLSHTHSMDVDGTTTDSPWERLDAKSDIFSSREFFSYAENLAYSGGSSANNVPIAHSIYNWIYDDAGSNWGHREFNLAILNENSGDGNAEGLVGFGVDTNSDSTTVKTYVVFNAYDPSYQWNRTGMSISCLAADLSGSSDTTGPNITVPANITVAATNANGTAATNTAISTFLAGASANDAQDGTVDVTNDAPSVLPLGTTTVVFSATDAAGNTSLASATITVADQTDPVITLLGGASVTVALNTSYTEAGAVAMDNVDGNITSSIVRTGAVDMTTTGTYTLTYTVTDTAANQVNISRTVTVTAPTTTVVVSNSGGTDSDGDGLTDTVEASIGTNPNLPDSDGDGIDDDEDSYPRAKTQAAHNGITLVTTPQSQNSGCSLAQVDGTTNPGTPPTGIISLGKAIDFRLTGCTVGETVTIKVDFGTLESNSLIYKVANGVWTPINDAIVINNRLVSYQLKDGGPLDADGLANGSISDPVTVGMLTGSTPTAGTSASTDTTPRPVPVLPPGAHILLLLGVMIVARASVRYHSMSPS